MLNRYFLIFGIALMAFAGSSLSTKLNVQWEVGVFAIGLLAIIYANISSLNLKIKTLEEKLESK